MPPRIAVAGIVAFWFATTAYTAYRDVWPRVFSSGPPPVSIELADEARQNIPARWTIKRNNQKIGKLETRMQYHDSNDSFQFTYRYSDLKLEQGDFTLASSESVSDVWITRGGQLREQSMSGKVQAQFRGVPVLDGAISVRGVVVDGVLLGRGELKSNLGNVVGDLEPVEVPKNGQPLNPLQPVNRLSGVRPGLTWKVHESNSLQDAMRGLVNKKLAENGIRLPEEKQKDSLVAQVDREQQILTVKGEEVLCWVIEYRRTEPVARTWVRASDGKVLRQEAFEKGESLMFERED